MTYYLIEIAEGDDKIKGKAIYEYATQNEALATFHTKLGTAMKSDLYKSVILEVIDSNGHIYDKTKFEKEYAPSVVEE